MKAIILRAWEWTRLRPISLTTPKPIIKIFDKPIIMHNIQHIYRYVDEIIIIVKYQKEKIIETIWNSYKNTKITYIEQNEEKWTARAIKWLNINDDILILNWDSIFDKKDLENICKLKWFWALVKEVKDPSKYWIFKKNNFNLAEYIIEKPKEYVWNLANLWAYKFSKDIINISKNITISERWEYEITDSINIFIQNHNFELITIKWEFIDIWYPWDILNANSYFLKKLKKSKINGKIEQWVKINWKIILEKWSIIKSWTYIEWNVYIWKNSIIWPNTYIRWETVLWNNSKIWSFCEIENSLIWDNTKIHSLTYLWDSVLWNNINIWRWTIVANTRHDMLNIKRIIKDKLIDTKLTKLWCIIWDNVKTWIKTIIYPWRIIPPNSITFPWQIVK